MPEPSATPTQVVEAFLDAFIALDLRENEFIILRKADPAADS